VSAPTFPWPARWADAQGPRPLLTVTTSWPTGPQSYAGSFVRALALAQRDQGHIVRVLAPACAAWPPREHPEGALSVRAVGFVGWRRSPFHGIGLPEALSEAPLRAGAPVAAAVAALGRALAAEARALGPRAHVIGHWLAPGGWLAQRAAASAGLEATTICHSGAARWAARLPRVLARPVILGALGPGEFVASCWDVVRALERGAGLPLAWRARVGPMPVIPPRRLGWPPPGPPWRVVVLGRLAPIKGIGLLLEALEGLPEVELHLCGDGPLRAALEREARARGVRAIFHGVLVGEARDALLSVCHALALPSRALPGGRTEGAPTALLEALSLGMPVVACAVGGVPELLEGRPRAWLVEPAAASLRAGLARLVEALAAPSGRGFHPAHLPHLQ
jgi:glycosyltransferase involved in cell wall biosynthesis